jgi:hypothetical protein
MLNDFEILDRAEILYPDIEELSDLRRFIIDEDWSSFFRLVETVDPLDGLIQTGVDLENLKKTILQNNLHSLFRIIENKLGTCSENTNIKEYFEDLRKATLEKNIHSIFRIIERPSLKKIIVNSDLRTLYKWLCAITNSTLLKGLYSLYTREISYSTDCVSRGQLLSKLWLIQEIRLLNLELGVTYLLGGWYATLGPLLKDYNINLTALRSFDIDPHCSTIAERINKEWEMSNWKFKATTLDIHNLDYKISSYKTLNNIGQGILIEESPNTLINTSCEHIENYHGWFNKVPSGMLLILQSNDYFSNHEHVNCVKNLGDFKEQTPLATYLFEGELDLGLYKRFMLIGYK